MTERSDFLWGHKIIMVDEDDYSLVALMIKNGERTSYKMNKEQDKSLYVLQGMVGLEMDGGKMALAQGASCTVPRKTLYRINALKTDVTVLEVGTALKDDEVVSEEG